MILKILLLIAVIALVYFLFFKKKTISTPSGKNTPETQDMVSCHQCGTYTSTDDALLKNGHYYCSRECMEA